VDRGAQEASGLSGCLRGEPRESETSPVGHRGDEYLDDPFLGLRQGQVNEVLAFRRTDDVRVPLVGLVLQMLSAVVLAERTIADLVPDGGALSGADRASRAAAPGLTGLLGSRQRPAVETSWSEASLPRRREPPSARNAEGHIEQRRIALTCGNAQAEWQGRRLAVNPERSCQQPSRPLTRENKFAWS
jgi:hypothetical protein